MNTVNTNVLSISMVLYRPDLSILERALFCLNKAAENLEGIRVELCLIDNSCDIVYANQIKKFMDQFLQSLNLLKINLTITNKNLGYGKANNLAIQQVNSAYHLVINPDVFVYEDSLFKAIDYMDKNPQVGLLTPAVFGEDGKQHYLCKKKPTLFDMFLRSFAPKLIKNKFSKRMENFEMRDRDYSKIIENVDFPSGCFMFFRTDKLQQLNGFDPAYFMHYEDADLGRRISEIAKVVYVPDVKIIHKWARATHKSFKFKWITIKSGLIYWRKWGGVF